MEAGWGCLVDKINLPFSSFIVLKHIALVNSIALVALPSQHKYNVPQISLWCARTEAHCSTLMPFVSTTWPWC